MRRLVIGDIHGCFDELQDLLDAAALAEQDQIIALGDIVDRGPDSLRVLSFFAATANACSLMGNHERKHVRSHRGQIRPALSQWITRRQIGEPGYADACRIMDGFPRCLELAEAILVHGFYEPGRSLAEQDESVIVGTLSGERHLGQRYRGPWYDLYDGDKPLIVGHHDYLNNGQPLIWRDRVYAIDTGCCHGGRLTGLLLPEFRLVSVPSRCDYWKRLQELHADLRYMTTPDERLTWEAAESIAAWAALPTHCPPETIERARRVSEMLCMGEQAVSELSRAISQRHESIVTQIASETNLDALTARKRQHYAAKTGRSPLARLLHQTRQGKLQPKALKHAFKGPAEAIALAQRSRASA